MKNLFKLTLVIALAFSANVLLAQEKANPKEKPASNKASTKEVKEQEAAKSETKAEPKKVEVKEKHSEKSVEKKKTSEPAKISVNEEGAPADKKDPKKHD